MPDELFIYLIVALNALTQILLIRSLRFPAGGKQKYYLCAIAIPVLLMLSMRLLIAGGMIHGRVDDQSSIEKIITTVASILLIGGPWLVTLAAILDKRRQGLAIKPEKDATGSR